MNQEKEKSATGIVVVVIAGLAFVILIFGLLCAGGALLIPGYRILREAPVVIAEAEEQLARAEAELEAEIAKQKAREKQDIEDGINPNVYNAIVVGVVDGEIITVLKEGAEQRVRVAGIDCPENGQPFHNRAKQLTTELCLNQKVIVEVEGHDDQGQETAQVYAIDARKIVSWELLRAGLAWRLKDVDDVDLTDFELQAKKSRVGLWAEDDPMPPWTWRENLGSPQG